MRSLKNMLDYEARKNPSLASLIADLDHLTPEEITNHPLRMLPWVRQQLLATKKSMAGRAVLEQTAKSIEGLIVDGFMPDPIGETRRWIGGNEFVKLSRPGHLEMHYGELIWLDQKGGAWIDTVYCRPYDSRLITCTSSIGQMSRLHYMDAVRERARGESSCDTPMLGNLKPPSPLASAGVRFYSV